MERYVRHECRWPYSILAVYLVNRITKSKSGTVIDCVNTVGFMVEVKDIGEVNENSSLRVFNVLGTAAVRIVQSRESALPK